MSLTNQYFNKTAVCLKEIISIDLKRNINCTICCLLVTLFSYPPLVLTQEKLGDVAVIFDQIANWFPRNGPSQVRESWLFATASSCQAQQWDPRQACLFDFCEIDEEHVFMWADGRQSLHISRPSFSTVVTVPLVVVVTWQRTMVTRRFTKKRVLYL